MLSLTNRPAPIFATQFVFPTGTLASCLSLLTLPEEAVATNFAQDVPAATAKIMTVKQGPIQGKSFGEPVTVAAWKNKANCHPVAAKDRLIQPALEQAWPRS